MNATYSVNKVPSLSEQQRSNNSNMIALKQVLTLLQKQLNIELIPNDDVLCRNMHRNIHQSYLQLKIQLRKIHKSYSTDLQQIARFNAKEIVQKIYKYKQFYIYCTTLYKDNTQLQNDVQKFRQYSKIFSNDFQQVRKYFMQPVIFELIFYQYFNTESTNQFTRIIIDLFWFRAQHQLLQNTSSNPTYTKQRKQDLISLDKKNIIFKQLYEINRKYNKIKQYISTSYISLEYLTNANLYKQQQSEQLLNIQIRNKIQHLQCLTQKVIKNNKPTITSNQNIIPNNIQIISEPLSNFTALSQQFSALHIKVSPKCKRFLQKLFADQSTTINNCPVQIINLEHQNCFFQSLKETIIKTQMLLSLNQMLSSFNLISHIYSEICGQVGVDQHIYQFTQILHCIGMQFHFINKPHLTVHKCQRRQGDRTTDKNSSIYIQTDEQDIWYLKCNHNKIIYPSAINNLVYFLKFLIHLSQYKCNDEQDIPNQEGELQMFEQVLQIVQLWSNLIKKWADVFYSIYSIIHNKQIGSYLTLGNYIKAVLSPNRYTSVLQKASCEQILQLVNKFTIKVDYIAQIIYELSTYHEVKPVLTKLVSIQQYYCNSNYTFEIVNFYRQVLYEIIQVRNNLKLNHFYSLNQIHQQFAYFTNTISSFDHLLIDFAQICKQKLLIKELMMFFAAQLKIKTAVFKAQLYWNITSNKSKQYNISKHKTDDYYFNFSDFISDKAKVLLDLSNASMQYFMSHSDYFEQQVNLFELQVQKMCMIKQIVMLSNDNDLQNYLRKLSYTEIDDIVWALQNNICVQQLLLNKCNNSYKIVEKIKNDIECKDNIKVEELVICCQQYKYQQKLLEIILINRVYSHAYIDNKLPNLDQILSGLRDKQDIITLYYAIIKSPIEVLCQIIKYYQLIMLLAWLEVSNIQNPNLSNGDCRILNHLFTFLQQYQCFKVLHNLRNILNLQTNLVMPNQVYHQMRVIMILKNYILNSKQSVRIQTDSKSNFKQCLSMIHQMSSYSRKLISSRIKHIQIDIVGLHHQISIVSKVELYYERLLAYSSKKFLNELSCILQQYAIGVCLNVDESIPNNIKILQAQAHKNVSKYYTPHNRILGTPIILFDELRGYEIDNNIEQTQNYNSKLCKQKDRKLPKKVIFVPHLKNVTEFQNLMSKIQKRVKIQIIQETMQVRKIISNLQMEQKLITNEILWQTCKLQHNAINKIQQFINDSNKDQQQSYINFKHTVNLQTSKGMEKVINDQTEMYRKRSKPNKQATSIHQDDNNDNMVFVTAYILEKHKKPTPNVKQILESKNQEILKQSVDSIMEHMKKIKFFSAWKNQVKKTDLMQIEWKKFNKNIGTILYNCSNLKTILHIKRLKYVYEKENFACFLLKEQNTQLNQQIREIKMKNLDKKMASYLFKDIFKNQKNQKNSKAVKQ